MCGFAKWYVKENGGKGELVGVASEDSNWFIAEEVLPKDAVLIAAAPELLDSLESAYAVMVDIQEKHLSGCAAVTRALLQKRIVSAKELINKVRGISVEAAA